MVMAMVLVSHISLCTFICRLNNNITLRQLIHVSNTSQEEKKKNHSSIAKYTKQENERVKRGYHCHHQQGQHGDTSTGEGGHDRSTQLSLHMLLF